MTSVCWTHKELVLLVHPDTSTLEFLSCFLTLQIGQPWYSYGYLLNFGTYCWNFSTLIYLSEKVYEIFLIRKWQVQHILHILIHTRIYTIHACLNEWRAGWMADIIWTCLYIWLFWKCLSESSGHFNTWYR